MRLRWERLHDEMSRGFSDDGHQLAQIAHVFGANGDDLGYRAWLSHEPGAGELFDRFATPEKAMSAAEDALDAKIESWHE